MEKSRQTWKVKKATKRAKNKNTLFKKKLTLKVGFIFNDLKLYECLKIISHLFSISKKINQKIDLICAIFKLSLLATYSLI